MKLTGAQIIAECLIEQGVDTVFGYPGGSVLNIYDALYEYSGRINHILTAHEQGAAHAADGYARASGKTGVVIATSGPGATNLVTGIATAYMDSTPMVAITGNVSLSLLGLDSFQEIDITGVTMPITKHNYIVKDINKLAGTIREAFMIAQSGRKGPVLIDIPKDLTSAVAEYSKITPPAPEKPAMKASESDIVKAAEVINAAERPFIYTGGGVIASGASEQVKKLADLTDAPVSSSLMGQGGFDNKDPKYIGMLGMHGTKTSSAAVSECDVFVGIGTRFSDRVICDIKSFAPNAQIIHIDIDPAEINKNISASIQLVGDAKDVLNALLKHINQQNHKEWLEYLNEVSEQYPLYQQPVGDTVTPQMVLEKLDELTNGNAVFTTEVGQHQMWAAQFLNFRKPRSFISSGGLGTMGFGLGASLGAQTARPDKRVINIAGDGSFHMNCNELVTAHKYNIPVIELLFNNNVLGMVRQWQRLFYGKRFSQTTLNRGTDYEMLARAYGVRAYTIKSRSDIEPVLKAALAEDTPAFINCIIDKDINVLPMVPAGGAVDKPILDINTEED